MVLFDQNLFDEPNESAAILFILDENEISGGSESDSETAESDSDDGVVASMAQSQDNSAAQSHTSIPTQSSIGTQDTKQDTKQAPGGVRMSPAQSTQTQTNIITAFQAVADASPYRSLSFCVASEQEDGDPESAWAAASAAQLLQDEFPGVKQPGQALLTIISVARDAQSGLVKDKYVCLHQGSQLTQSTIQAFIDAWANGSAQRLLIKSEHVELDEENAIIHVSRDSFTDRVLKRDGSTLVFSGAGGSRMLKHIAPAVLHDISSHSLRDGSDEKDAPESSIHVATYDTDLNDAPAVDIHHWATHPSVSWYTDGKLDMEKTRHLHGIVSTHLGPNAPQHGEARAKAAAETALAVVGRVNLELGAPPRLTSYSFRRTYAACSILFLSSSGWSSRRKGIWKRSPKGCLADFKQLAIDDSKSAISSESKKQLTFHVLREGQDGYEDELDNIGIRSENISALFAIFEHKQKLKYVCRARGARLTGARMRQHVKAWRDGSLAAWFKSAEVPTPPLDTSPDSTGVFHAVNSTLEAIVQRNKCVLIGYREIEKTEAVLSAQATAEMLRRTPPGCPARAVRVIIIDLDANEPNSKYFGKSRSNALPKHILWCTDPFMDESFDAKDAKTHSGIQKTDTRHSDRLSDRSFDHLSDHSTSSPPPPHIAAPSVLARDIIATVLAKLGGDVCESVQATLSSDFKRREMRAKVYDFGFRRVVWEPEIANALTILAPPVRPLPTAVATRHVLTHLVVEPGVFRSVEIPYYAYAGTRLVPNRIVAIAIGVSHIRHDTPPVSDVWVNWIRSVETVADFEKKVSPESGETDGKSFDQSPIQWSLVTPATRRISISRYDPPVVLTGAKMVLRMGPSWDDMKQSTMRNFNSQTFFEGKQGAGTDFLCLEYLQRDRLLTQAQLELTSKITNPKTVLVKPLLSRRVTDADMEMRSRAQMSGTSHISVDMKTRRTARDDDAWATANWNSVKAFCGVRLIGVDIPTRDSRDDGDTAELGDRDDNKTDNSSFVVDDKTTDTLGSSAASRIGLLGTVDAAECLRKTGARAAPISSAATRVSIYSDVYYKSLLDYKKKRPRIGVLSLSPNALFSPQGSRVVAEVYAVASAYSRVARSGPTRSDSASTQAKDQEILFVIKADAAQRSNFSVVSNGQQFEFNGSIEDLNAEKIKTFLRLSDAPLGAGRSSLVRALTATNIEKQISKAVYTLLVVHTDNVNSRAAMRVVRSVAAILTKSKSARSSVRFAQIHSGRNDIPRSIRAHVARLGIPPHVMLFQGGAVGKQRSAWVFGRSGAQGSVLTAPKLLKFIEEHTKIQPVGLGLLREAKAAPTPFEKDPPGLPTFDPRRADIASRLLDYFFGDELGRAPETGPRFRPNGLRRLRRVLSTGHAIRAVENACRVVDVDRTDSIGYNEMAGCVLLILGRVVDQAIPISQWGSMRKRQTSHARALLTEKIEEALQCYYGDVDLQDAVGVRLDDGGGGISGGKGAQRLYKLVLGLMYVVLLRFHEGISDMGAGERFASLLPVMDRMDPTRGNVPAEKGLLSLIRARFEKLSNPDDPAYERPSLGIGRLLLKVSPTRAFF